ncbi:MAG: RNA polymerase sigma factor [Phycisphaerales bacterium]|jgi:RNA polymerase sigma-70 factor (ECF subfamily)
MLKTIERRLIRKAQTGDGAAIESLIRGHQDALYAFMLRMSGRPDVAEDMVQEAFVRVIRNLDRFDTRFRFSTWLFTIARRLYVNHMQKLRPSPDSDVVDGMGDRGESPGGATARHESLVNLRTVIDEALQVLTPLQREIVLLFHQQTWSITDIAAHLTMPEGTVKSHLHRARRRMQRSISASPVARAHAAEVLS